MFFKSNFLNELQSPSELKPEMIVSPTNLKIVVKNNRPSMTGENLEL
jgi:hypothetical protein